MRRHPSKCEVPIGADELRIAVVHHAGKKLRRVWDRTLATLLLGTSGPCATRTRYRTLLRRAVMYLVIRHDTVPQVCTVLFTEVAQVCYIPYLTGYKVIIARLAFY